MDLHSFFIVLPLFQIIEEESISSGYLTSNPVSVIPLYQHAEIRQKFGRQRPNMLVAIWIVVNFWTRMYDEDFMLLNR